MNQEQIHQVTAHDEKWVLAKERVKISGNEYSLKDKNKAKTNKTEHGNGKSVKSQSQRRVHLKWANPHPI
ncbi:hypothetical protein Tco_0625975 [Tanacetum coccineum]|uniref:Uncharacterized protein n=1 Tax=Tanacetum coccineum TaxID=301880 RepID=A0ABQ4WIG8_9ASTR